MDEDQLYRRVWWRGVIELVLIGTLVAIALGLFALMVLGWRF
jgi:hypothetical protein